jgi:adenylate kinase family enzyme
MKIHIIGGCGSGKTYISRLLSKRLGIVHYQTDNLVWDRNNDTRYPETIRDKKLSEIVKRDSWIIEGVHYKWVYGRLKEADYIFIIEPNIFIQNWRTIKRFIKTRLRLEEQNYTQDFKNLLVMFGWNQRFEQEEMGKIMEITSEFLEKRRIVKNNLDILKSLKM